MKKSNVILQAAIASALMAISGSAAAAATLTATGISYATEQFSGSAAQAAVVLPGTIVVGAGTAIPANSTVTVAIALTGGVWASIPNALMASSSISQAGTMSATSSTLLVPLTLIASSSIGIGSTILTVPAASATFTTTSLATAGNTITATAAVYLGTVTSANLATATVYDAASSASTLATSAAGVTLSAAANTGTSKIDLTASTPAMLFTSTTASALETASTTTFKLGRLYIKDNGKKVFNGATDFTTAVSAGYTAGTIAASAGFFSALGTTGVITLKDASAAYNTANGGAFSNACAAVTASATSATMTAAAALAATSVSVAAAGFSGSTSGSGYPYDVCYTIAGTSAYPQASGTPTLAVSQQDAATATRGTATLAATSMMALSTNGQTYDVRNYVPAAQTGYTTYVRVINTGTLSAVISVALIDGTTGTASTTGSLGTLAAGAAANFSSTQVEAALLAAGVTAPAATTRPRLRITAPTSGMNVQTFLFDAAGNFADMTGAQ